MCSHTIACLDICGKHTEMKVVIVKMIDVFFFGSRGKGTPLVNIKYMQTYTTFDIVGSLRWSTHADGSVQRDIVKGRAVYFGHVVVQVKACNVLRELEW